MKKEILTRDKFSKDFAKNRVPSLIFINLFLYGLVWVCVWLISLVLKYPIIPKICGVVFVLAYLGELTDYIIKCIRLKKGKYYLLKDSLIGNSQYNLLHERAFFHFFALHNAPHNLNFKCYGWYRIPYGENYSWSSKHNMMESSVYNCSNIGDEFYIVSFNKKKIALVYNTKLFEFKD